MKLDPAIQLEAAKHEAEAKKLLEQAGLAEMRVLALSNLYVFAKDVLGLDPAVIRGMDDPGVLAAVSELNTELQDWLAKRKSQTRFRKVLWIMPRECFKTTYGSAAVVQAHCRIPNGAFAISSASYDRMAVPTGRAIREHWEGTNEKSLLVRLFGNFKDPAGRRKWAEDEAITLARRSTTRRDPTLKVFSVETGGTSGHYEMVLLDDPITQEQVHKYGDTWFDRVWTHYNSLRFVVRRDGLLLVICTRYGDQDLVGRLIEREIEPRVRKWWKNARRTYNEEELRGSDLPPDFHEKWFLPKYAGQAGWKVIFRDAEREDGEPRFPVVWPKERMADVRFNDPVGASTQLDNRPWSRADSPVVQVHIDRTWEEPHQVPPLAYTHLTLHGDTAFKDAEARMRARGDWNVLFGVGHAEGHIHLVWGWHSKTADEGEFADQLIRAVQWAASTHRARFGCLTLDKTVGSTGGMTRNFLIARCNASGVRCPNVVELKRDASRTVGSGRRRVKANILASAGYWQDSRVHLVRGVQGADEAAWEMLNMLGHGTDDHADCLSDAFNEEIYKPERRSTQTALEKDAVSLGTLRPFEFGLRASPKRETEIGKALRHPFLEMMMGERN